MRLVANRFVAFHSILCSVYMLLCTRYWNRRRRYRFYHGKSQPARRQRDTILFEFSVLLDG